MVKNYFQIAFRNLKRSLAFSGLNIMGLALGMAAFLFLVQYVSYEKSFDKFHENYENIYRVRYKLYEGNKLQSDNAAATPRIGPFMRETMPEVQRFARANPLPGVVVTYKEQNFHEDKIQIVDSSFLKIFSYKLLKGNVDDALSKPNKVVVTQSTADKYFGSVDPLGKVIVIHGVPGNDNFEVSGVMADVPPNSHFKFDFLISWPTLKSWVNSIEDDWNWTGFVTYVQLEPNTNNESFNRRFSEILDKERGSSFKQANYRQEFLLQPIEDIHLHSDLLFESEPEEQGDGDIVLFLTLIAFLILAIAWANYINLATAKSLDRAKEVGVRKTMGVSQRELITQFLVEAFTVNLIALIIGLLLVVGGINYFNEVTNAQLNLLFLTNIRFWVEVLLVLFLGSILSGLYPALVLSSFSPITILKSKSYKGPSSPWMRRALVVLQFSVSVALIIGTTVVYLQLKHMRSEDVGFDQDRMMLLKGPGVIDDEEIQNFGTFRTELLRNAQISAVTSSTSVPGDEIIWKPRIKRSQDPNTAYQAIDNLWVDDAYFETYGIEVVTGRGFSSETSKDSSSIIINMAALGMLGFESTESAIDQMVNIWGKRYHIIGIVANYNHLSVKKHIAPLAFLYQLGSADYYTIKFASNDYQNTISHIQKLYTSFYPSNPFEFHFLGEFYDRQYRNEQEFSQVFTFFAGFAIFVACLGLFGLASFNSSRRAKEIGIRKILGAEIEGVVFLMTKEFIILVLLSNLIAWPLAYITMNSWLSNFASKIDISAWVFIGSGILVLLIALLTVGYSTLAIAKLNPAKVLRDE